jgi:cobyrinic acid a,c-diamide synthase
MCGVLPADATMTGHLTLGYREATAMSDSVLARAGTTVRGHEFHRTVAHPGFGSRPAWRWSGPDGSERLEGFAQARVHASYLHLHWAGVPGAARSLVAAAQLAAIKAEA